MTRSAARHGAAQFIKGMLPENPKVTRSYEPGIFTPGKELTGEIPKVQSCNERKIYTCGLL